MYYRCRRDIDDACVCDLPVQLLRRKYFRRDNDGELGKFGVDTEDDNHSSSQSAMRGSDEEPDEEPARPREERTAVSAPDALANYDENGYAVGAWSFPGPPFDPYEDCPENRPFF
jgi:hypothetical protein